MRGSERELVATMRKKKKKNFLKYSKFSSRKLWSTPGFYFSINFYTKWNSKLMDFRQPFTRRG